MFFWQSCYEPQEGCLDVRATNFNLRADKPCLDCCEFPQLRVSWQHIVALPDTIYNLAYRDSIYFDGSGNPFTVNNIQFYLSEFHLVRADGTEEGVNNEVSFRIPRSTGDTLSETREDNFSLVNPGFPQTLNIGNFEATGSFSQVRFLLGIDVPTNQAEPSSFPEDHPLSLDNLHWNLDSGYIFNQIQLFRGITEADTTLTFINIGLSDRLVEVTLDIPNGFTLSEGFDVIITLQIDYNHWFRAINDVRLDLEEDMLTNIVRELSQSFSFVDIVQDSG